MKSHNSAPKSATSMLQMGESWCIFIHSEGFAQFFGTCGGQKNPVGLCPAPRWTPPYLRFSFSIKFSFFGNDQDFASQSLKDHLWALPGRMRRDAQARHVAATNTHSETRLVLDRVEDPSRRKHNVATRLLCHHSLMWQT